MPAARRPELAATGEGLGERLWVGLFVPQQKLAWRRVDMIAASGILLF